MKRKHPLKTGDIHHVLNRSIAKYIIFNSDDDYKRMILMLLFFSFEGGNLPKFSHFNSSSSVKNKGFENELYERVEEKDKRVQIIAYCIMPTHFHLILKQLTDNGISDFVGRTSNSYSHYFNNKNNRRGRLWEDKFKNVPVNSDEQLLHLTRYIHLNPVTARLIEDPKDWKYSSYHEYIQTDNNHSMCEFKNLIDTSPEKYKEFVMARKEYQRELAKIKNITLE